MFPAKQVASVASREWHEVHKNRYTCRKTVTVLKLLFQKVVIVQGDSECSRFRKNPFPLTRDKRHKFQLGSHCCRSLGAFAKSRKATVHFVMSVRPFLYMSVYMGQFGSHLKHFHEILYLSVFGQSTEKIQFSSKI
jgi:hypothetical protein